jgi:hypothetical protein
VLVQSIAQSTEERELEDKIPKHLPIRVKLKKEKEKAFKDLKNEKWLRDFELEVTNIGDKPIYFLSLHITLPEIRAPNGDNIVFGLYYGRAALGGIKTKAESEDIPIKPGETHIFSLAYKQEAWESSKREEHWPQPKKLQIKFQILSFGDGTGFWGGNGIAVPHAINKPPGTGRCEQHPNENALKTIERQHASPDNSPTILSINILPASFSPAIFLSSELLKFPSFGPNPQSQLCCSSTNCWYSVPDVDEGCFCGPEERLLGTFCSDPFGSCVVPIPGQDICVVSGVIFYCTKTTFEYCGNSTPAPTPTPYPTPDPFPTPEPSPSPDATPCPSLVCADPNAVPASSCPDFLGSHCPAGYSLEGKVLTSICDGRISDFV